MGYSKYVGRIGALAVALGIGTAVAQPAWAETPSNDTETSSKPADNDAPAENNPPTGPSSPSPDVTESKDLDGPSLSTDDDDTSELTDEDEEDEWDEASLREEEMAEPPMVPGDTEQPSLINTTQDPTTPSSPPEPPTEPIEPAASSSTPDLTGNEQQVPTPNVAPIQGRFTTQVDSDIEGVTLRSMAGPSTLGITTAAVPTVPSPAPLQQQPNNPLEIVIGTAGKLINIAAGAIGMLFSPIFTPGYNGPGGLALVFATLDMVRRELDRAFSNSSPTAVADLATTSELVPTTIAALANDVDPNLGQGDILTVVGYTQASNGTVVLNSNGSFTYTPNAGFSGVDTFTYTISDDASPWHIHGLAGLFGRGGHASTAAVTITVGEAPVNVAPVARPDSATITQGSGPTTINVLGNDNDADNDPLTITDVTQPENGTVTFTTTGVSYAPDETFAGTDSFTYTVSDGTTTTVGTVTVTVTPVIVVNAPPTAVDDNVSTAEDTTINIDITANDTDPEDDPLQLTAVSSAGNGTVAINGATVTYTPNPDWHGIDTFTYTISDGEHEDTATVTVVVIPVNESPVANDDSVSLPQGSGSTLIDVLANDTDADNAPTPLQVTGVTQPANGAVTPSSTGLSYTPNAGFSGTDTFTYTITDGTSFDSATVTVTVTPVVVVNSPPTAVDDNATTAEDTAVTIAVTANDTDPEDDDLTVTTVSTPGNGTVAINGNTITYTPNANWHGTDTFTYTITDGDNDDTATVTVTVTPVADPPPNQLPTVHPSEPYTILNITSDGVVTGTINVYDPDSTLSYSVVGTPNGGGVIVGSDGRFVFTPHIDARENAYNTAGPDYGSFTVSVSDGIGTVTVDVAIAIVESAPDSPPTAGEPAFVITDTGADGVVRGYVNITDADSQLLFSVKHPVHYTIGSLVVDESTGAFVFTPSGQARLNAWRAGGDDLLAFSIVATDGKRTVDVAVTVPITAADLNGAPQTGDPGYQVHHVDLETGTVSGRVIAYDPDNDSLTYTLTSLVDESVGVLQINSATGYFTFAPTEGARSGLHTSLTVQFDVAVTDGYATTVVGVVAPIVSSNHSPFAADPKYTVVQINPVNGHVSGRVHINDVDDGPLGTLTYSLGSSIDPALGTVQIDSSTGEFTFAPNTAARIDAGAADTGRTVSFVVITSDPLASVSVTVTAPIVPVQAFATHQITSDIRGIPGSDENALHGPTVAANGTAYQTTSRWDSVAGISITRITVVRPTGGTTMVEVMGHPASPVTIGSDGSAYQTVSYLHGGTHRTGLLVVSPSGEETFTGYVDGVATGAPALTASGSAHLVLGSAGNSTTIIHVDPNRETTIETYSGRPQETVVAPDGTVFVTTEKYSSSSGYTATVITISASGTTTFDVPGRASGPLLIGIDGLGYQVFTELTYNGPRAAVARLAASGSQILPNTLSGNPVGDLVTGPAGELYQLVQRQNSAVIAVVGADGLTAIADPLPGYIAGTAVADNDSVHLAIYRFDETTQGYVTRIISATAQGVTSSGPLNGIPWTQDNGGEPEALKLASDGTVYLVTRSADFGSYTFVAVSPADSIAVPLTGHPSGSILLGNNGTAYQMASRWDETAGTSITTVAIIKSQTTRVIEIVGDVVDSLVAGPDGVLFATTSSTGPSGKKTIRITVITSAGHTTHVVDNPVSDTTLTTLAGRLVLGSDGVVYQTFAVTKDGTVSTVVMSVSADSMTAVSDALEGSPGGSVTFGPNGTVYQVVTKESTAGKPTSVIYVIGAQREANEEPQPLTNPYSISDVNTTTGAATGVVHVEDGDGDRLHYSLSHSVNPERGTVVINERTGAFVFTPSADAREAAWSTPDSDSFTFTVIAGDGQATVEIVVEVPILPANHQPVAGIPAFSATPDPSTGSVIGRVHVTERDPGDALTYSLLGSVDPSKALVEVNAEDGSFIVTPTVTTRESAWLDATTTIEFVVRVTSGTDQVDIVVELKVVPLEPINDPPQVIGTGYSIDSVGIYSGVVIGSTLVTDPDNDSLTFSLASTVDPAIGTVVLDPTNGIWAFQASPQARFAVANSSGPSVAEFAILVTDGELTSTIPVIVTISAAVDFTETSAALGGTPLGIATGTNGLLYVANYGSGTVWVLGADGGVVTTIDTTLGVPGAAAGLIAAAPDGSIYLTVALDPSEASSILVRIDPAAGHTVQVIADLGATQVSSLGVDAAGLIYAYDMLSGSLMVLRADGTQHAAVSLSDLRFGDEPATVRVVAIGPDDKIYAAASGWESDAVFVLAHDGSIESSFAIGSSPSRITVDADGMIYVADEFGTITAYHGGVEVGQAYLPQYAFGLAVSESGTLYATLPGGGQLVSLTAVPREPTRYSMTVDEDTGKVTGRVFVLHPPAPITYSLGGAIDPSIGEVLVDGDTGRWVFTPTSLARTAALETSGADTISISINATYGSFASTFDIEVLIVPASSDIAATVEVVENVADQATGVAVDVNGRLYVADYADGTIVIRNPDGSTEPDLVLDALPFDIAIGPESHLYISDTAANRILVVDLATGGQPQVHATIVAPTGLAVGADGRLYVSSLESETVTVLNSDGSIAAAIPVGSTSYDVAVDADGSIYTLVGNGVRVTNPNGSSHTFDIEGAAFGIAVDSVGRIYATRYGTGSVIVIEPDGRTFELATVGQLPVGIAVGAEGRIYVADAMSGDVHVLTLGTGSSIADPPEFGDLLDGFPGSTGMNQLSGPSVNHLGQIFQTLTTAPASSGGGAGAIRLVAFGQAVSKPIIGQPVGSIVFGPDGSAYQVIYDPSSNTTKVLHFRTSGTFETSEAVSGTSAGKIVAAADGTAYLVVQNGVLTTLLAISPFGNSATQVSGTATTPFSEPIELVAIGDTAYLVLNSVGASEQTVTLAVATPSGVSLHNVPGIAWGSPARGADGTAYLITVSFDPTTGTPRTSLMRLTAQEISPVGDPIVGFPRGQLVSSPSGLLHQFVTLTTNPIDTTAPIALLTFGPGGTLVGNTTISSGAAILDSNPMVFGPDGTGFYLFDEPTQTRVVVVSQSGDVAVHTVTAGSAEHIVAGPNGTAAIIHPRSDSTSVSVVTSAGVTTYQLDGLPGSSIMGGYQEPSIAPDGTVYQVLSETGEWGAAPTLKIVAITPAGDITTYEVSGLTAEISLVGNRAFVSIIAGTLGLNSITTTLAVLTADGVETIGDSVAGIPVGSIIKAGDGQLLQAFVFTQGPSGSRLVTTVVAIGSIADFNSAPETESTAVTSVSDPDTGVVHGQVHVFDADDDAVRYSLVSSLDPAIGTLTVDELTGTWTFKPTVAARHAAAANPDGSHLELSIMAFDGAASTFILVAVEVVALEQINHAPIVRVDATTVVVDADTGVVSGRIDAIDVDRNPITFRIADALDPTIGSLSIDPYTGVWTLTPSRQSLAQSWSRGEGIAVGFEVVVGDGHAETSVNIATEIDNTAAALANALEFSGSRPAGVAVGSDGRIYVIDSGASTLTVLNPTDWSRTTVRVGLHPSAIAIAPSGEIWITNAGDNTVTIVNSNGTVVGGAAVGRTPTGIAVDRFGRSFVVNSGDGTISVLGPHGTTQPAGTISVGDGPRSIAIGPDGRLYVTNLADDTITVINPDADYSVNTIDHVGTNPFGIAVGADGTVYVTNPFSDTITVLTPNGSDYQRHTVDAAGTPTAIAVASDGSVYITMAGTDSINRLNPANLSLTPYAVGENPTGAAITSAGDVVVANGDSATITVVRPGSSQPIHTVNVASKPYTVTVGADNSLVVTDNHTGRLTVIPVGASTSVNIDISSTQWSMGTPWAIGPNATTYYLRNTSFIFPETSLFAYDSSGRLISNSTVAFMWDRYPYSPVVAPDGRVFYLLESYNPYTNGGAGEPETYVMSVNPINPTGLHYMYETLDRVGDPRPEGLQNATIGPDGRLYVQSVDYVLVFEMDGDPWGARIPFTYARPHELGMTLGPDGRIYGFTKHGETPSLEVIDPDSGISTIVDLPHHAGNVLVGGDGRVYLTGYDSTTLTVLRPDYSVETVLDLGVATGQLVMGPNGYLVLPTAFGVAVLDPGANYAMRTVDLGGSTQIVPDPAGNGAIYLSTQTASGTTLTRLSIPGTFAPLEDPVGSSTDLLQRIIEWAERNPVPTEASLAAALTDFLTNYVYDYAKLIDDFAKKQHIKAVFDTLPPFMKDATLGNISKLADGSLRIPPSTVANVVNMMKVAFKAISFVSTPLNIIDAFNQSNEAQTDTEKARAVVATIAAWAPFFTAAVGGVVAGPAGIIPGWGIGAALGLGLNIGNMLTALIEGAIEPDPPAPATPVFSTSPSSMADLYTRLRETTGSADEGIYIETVQDDEGNNARLIVYIGGTNPSNWISGSQAIVENNAYFHNLKSEHLEAIDAALRKAPGSRIMLVGYSQGGMDAQNIAASGRYNVTTVVTYGSPIVRPVSTSYRTIHLWADNDRVTDFTNVRYGDYDEDALNRGQLFRAASDTQDDGWWKIHAEIGTYQRIGDLFDDSPAGRAAAFWGVKNNIQQFMGQPVLHIPDGQVYVDGVLVSTF